MKYTVLRTVDINVIVITQKCVAQNTSVLCYSLA